jgi:hypothetical protein
MNEQQTRELAKQYRERAAIMEAAKWVDGECVNLLARFVDVTGERTRFSNAHDPVWDFETNEYRIFVPDVIRYYAWWDNHPSGEFETFEEAQQFALRNNDRLILKVTTKPDGTKTAEFIEVGK